MPQWEKTVAPHPEVVEKTKGANTREVRGAGPATEGVCNESGFIYYQGQSEGIIMATSGNIKLII